MMNKRQLIMVPVLLLSGYVHAHDFGIHSQKITQADASKLSSKLEFLKKAPYDEKAYQLSYKTLIYNAHMMDAYQLALIAVAKAPDDLSWHEALAQSAGWVGDYNTSMSQWLYVAQHTKEIKTIKKAASLATLLGYDEVSIPILKLYLSKEPDAFSEMLDLARAENRINQAQNAIQTLNALNAKHPTREAVELMAKVYQDMDQWDEALLIWKKMDADYGLSIQSIMAQATIYYSKKQFKDALNVLSKGVSLAQKSDTAFWHAIADLAWMLSDKSLAIVGYAHALDDPSSVFSLIGLVQTEHPKEALQYSLNGWAQFHQMTFFSSALYLASAQKDWVAVAHLIKSLNAKENQEAQRTLPFWEAQASMYAAFGEDDLQKNLLIQGIMTHPELTLLRVNLLFLLITKGELHSVKLLMQDGYLHDSWNNIDSWKVFADALDVFNKGHAAMILYQEHMTQSRQQSQVLIDYARLLEKVKLKQQANNVWGALWQDALGHLNQAGSLDKNLYQTLSQVAPYFVSGTAQIRLLNQLFTSPLSNEDLVILLNWMVPRNYFELITYFKAAYFNNVLPVWAGTNLALARNDLPTLQKMLEHNGISSFSRADLINAAVRMENTPLAVDLAFSELSERPQATDIYDELTQYGLANANWVNLAEEYEQFVTVAGARTKLDTQFRLTNSWKIAPSISFWSVQSTAPNSITNVPSEDVLANIRLSQKIHRGTLEYSLGYREDLNGFMPASLGGTYQLSARWSARFKAGYNQENFQNAYMREGGVQDQINLGLQGTITKYDALIFELQGLNYYGQDRTYLADGFILAGIYEHKFWLSYPDYTIGLFGNAYQFNRNGQFAGDVTTLFPALPPSIQADPIARAAANEANYQQLIPNNYNEAGVSFSFGSTILEYSHAWRPYLWASLYYNSITALSNEIKAGINGSVFGRDSLLIYAERGTAQSNQGQTNYMLRMRYLLYY